MDIANFGANFSMVREHLTLFALVAFATPLISFVSSKFRTAARASIVRHAIRGMLSPVEIRNRRTRS
jgi:lipoprotein signal peptidase